MNKKIVLILFLVFVFIGVFAGAGFIYPDNPIVSEPIDITLTSEEQSVLLGGSLDKNFFVGEIKCESEDTGKCFFQANYGDLNIDGLRNKTELLNKRFCETTDENRKCIWHYYAQEELDKMRNTKVSETITNYAKSLNEAQARAEAKANAVIVATSTTATIK